MIWVQFIISAVVIVIAGVRLTTFSDKLSDQLHLGKMWVGIVLLGLVTSLPEAISSLVAIVYLDAPDLAIGNIVGSNNFNPILIVVMDVAYRTGSITNKIKLQKSHYLSASFVVLLSLVLMVEILIGPNIGFGASGFFTLGNILIVVLYFGGLKILSTVDQPQEAFDSTDETHSLKSIWGNIIVSSIFIIGAAFVLSNTADHIASQTGLGRTFVGSIFLAFVTSLPEMVVTISALKLGVFDLAIGNILGSNMTNIFIVSLCNIFYNNGSVLHNVALAHVWTAALSICLICILILGLRSNKKKEIFGIGVDSFLMLGLFVGGIAALYQLR